MSAAPKRLFDVDRGMPAWDHDGARYLLTEHAQQRLIEMGGKGAVNLVGHVLAHGRWIDPPNSSRYAYKSKWVVLGDLTLAVMVQGRRRNIVTALFSSDEAWERHLLKRSGTDRKLRRGFLVNKHIADVLNPVRIATN